MERETDEQASVSKCCSRIRRRYVRRASESGRLGHVYKDPNCGCCHAWTDALDQSGFSVIVEDVTDLSAIKTRYNVPDAMQGCHTGVIDGKYLEGHFPLEAMQRMLRKRPDIDGLAVPGMPSGPLGMGNNPGSSYDVFAIPKGAGAPLIYQSVRPKKT